MQGFGVAAGVWVDAGKKIREAAEVLAHGRRDGEGVNAFCRAVGGHPFGSDALGRALFQGDSRSGSPGFVGLRDGLLKDLAWTVNLLRGMAAGLVVSGGTYRETDGTIVEGLGGRPGPVADASPGWLRVPESYVLPQVPGGLPSSAAAPDIWVRAEKVLGWMGVPCQWPEGDLFDPLGDQRDAARSMKAVVEYVAEEVAGHARRVTGSGFGAATDAFASTAHVVHGEAGLLASLAARCEQLARYCERSRNAVITARSLCVATATFVVGLMIYSTALGGWIDGLVAPLIKAEGLALQIALRLIRDAVLGMSFTAGVDGIGQLFRWDGFHPGELAEQLLQGLLVGGFMGFGTHAVSPDLIGRSPALAWLSRWSRSPGAGGFATRYALSGGIGTGAIWTADGITGHGWNLHNLQDAAKTGFGMALIGFGTGLAGRTGTTGPSAKSTAPAAVGGTTKKPTAYTLDTLLEVAESNDLATARYMLERDPRLARELYSHALESPALRGNSNGNFKLGNLKVRLPDMSADGFDLRIFRENDVVSAIEPHLGRKASRLVYVGPGWSVHAFEEGRALHEVAPPDEPVPRFVLSDMVDLFRRLADVPWQDLPLPAGWPPDRDTAAFGVRLAMHTEGVHATFRDRFDSVFGPLHVPERPLQPIFDRFETLTPRPFRLLHHDLHRGNIILRPDNQTVILDWELALVGDPVSDLASHFHLMRYSKAEQRAVLRGWLDEMPPALTEGWQPDLEHYLKFRRVQSVIHDIIRTTRYIGRKNASLDEGHNLIVDLTDKLNAAGRQVWGWKEPLSVDYVTEIIRAFHNSR
jgi:hypothetical protein